ncbi:MAG TPA: SUMF1/EgtB/PvdO family nonheme iron enzyme [Xanthobacteraceae bacterium]|nr:SUMF1/EgtB/PvdO family nonheme iron enzyme [Xanthobacteraceae bacterium]
MLFALKIKTLVAAAVVAGPVAVSAVSLGGRTHSPGAGVTVPETVEVAPGAFRHRAAGDYTRDGAPAAAPVTEVRFVHPLRIMRDQVSAGDYQRCVAAGVCAPADGDRGDLPAVQVSWRDASAYASWLSRATGVHFRLPTDEEWAYAAGERFNDDAAAYPTDPGQRALARYERETARNDALAQDPQPIGAFGANANGLLDVAGNVWEWTDSCFRRGVLDAAGQPHGPATMNCGVRVVEGRHRTYVTDFIRDTRAGGCAAGTPPTHLGFRLVREDDMPAVAARVFDRIRTLVGRLV